MKLSMDEIRELEEKLQDGFQDSRSHEAAKARLGILRGELQISRERKRAILKKIAFSDVTTVYTTGSPTQEFEQPEF